MYYLQEQPVNLQTISLDSSPQVQPLIVDENGYQGFEIKSQDIKIEYFVVFGHICTAKRTQSPQYYCQTLI